MSCTPCVQVQRVDVPFVPGAFVLCGLLTPHECAQLVAATEALGYAWDVDYRWASDTEASCGMDSTTILVVQHGPYARVEGAS
jgi:hypothetical protein